MRTKKQTTVILVIAILLISSLSVTVLAEFNPNPDQGKTTTNASYMSSDNTAENEAAQYGNLINEQYAWNQWIGGSGSRTGFTGGPAPVRPDVLWRTRDIPEVGTVQNGMIAFSGKLFFVSSISGQQTLNALHPHTGAVLWQTPFPAGMSVTVAFGASVIYKSDDSHLVVLTNQGLAMFDASNGNLLWSDATILPNAAYFRAVVDNDLTMMFGPIREVPGDPLRSEPFTDVMCGWDLSNPAVDKGDGGRLIWEYIMDEPGNPLLCAGDGKVFVGSYSSSMIYALDATTGNKIWETARSDAAGYSAAYQDGKLVVGCQSQWIICYDAVAVK
jgi:outer membrane protein assembly factor BamB